MEIERDAVGELRRYFNQWFFKEAQKNVEIDIDHPRSLQQVIEQAQMNIQHQRRRSQSPSEVITSGDEEDCAVKLKYVQQLLLMSEDELLARLAYLKKVIVPK
ncbi:MAG TPA: hypothetical protein H9889_08905 [Candidatus Ignatzschineria merdigallinarum]|uniref:Uncharacterized protein n=1 Tax=Candidatus Ignatzschineria merdigallinarum TaxID=2838621 RepID=A0A9D1Q7M7_9GAMM|nr:hypothetical protein [Candidatus Ignatzschineria merdigallinarum]